MLNSIASKLVEVLVHDGAGGTRGRGGHLLLFPELDPWLILTVLLEIFSVARL